MHDKPVTNFRCIYHGTDVQADVRNNNAAFECPLCGHPVLFGTFSGFGMSQNNPAECPNEECGNKFWGSIDKDAGTIRLQDKWEESLRPKKAEKSKEDSAGPVWKMITWGIIIGLLVWFFWPEKATLPSYPALTSGAPEAAAFEKLMEDAEEGDVNSQYELGGIYISGKTVPKDNAEAVKWYSLAGDLGHADAQLALARIYNEKGALQDKQESAKWLLLAAEQGIADAQFMAGEIHYKGEGVPQDKEEAAMWYRRAAEQGNCDAQEELVSMYYTGDGVEKDWHEAGVWYLIALGTHNVSGWSDSEGSKQKWDEFSLLMTDSEINAMKIDARQRIETFEKWERDTCYISLRSIFRKAWVSDD